MKKIFITQIEHLTKITQCRTPKYDQISQTEDKLALRRRHADGQLIFLRASIDSVLYNFLNRRVQQHIPQTTRGLTTLPPRIPPKSNQGLGAEPDVVPQEHVATTYETKDNAYKHDNK